MTINRRQNQTLVTAVAVRERHARVRFLATVRSKPRTGAAPLHFDRRGMTLAELLIGMVIMGLMTVVLAGMSNAVSSAWNYTKGVEVTEQSAAAAFDRIKYMLAQVGTYRLTGQPTRLGVAVVSRTVGSTTIPDVLVLWTGGRNGGMAVSGTQARLPVASELLVYTWDSSQPSQLLEIVFPGSSGNIDFAATDFSTTITSLLAVTTADRIPLCDHLRVSSLSNVATTTASSGSSASTAMYGSMGGSSMYGPSVTTSATTSSTTSTASANSASSQLVGCARFDIAWAPTDSELASATAGSTQWYQLTWPQGAVGSRSGVRQVTLNFELQIEPDGVVAGAGSVNAIPFFDSESVRYVYEP